MNADVALRIRAGLNLLGCKPAILDDLTQLIADDRLAVVVTATAAQGIPVVDQEQPDEKAGEPHTSTIFQGRGLFVVKRPVTESGLYSEEAGVNTGLGLGELSFFSATNVYPAALARARSAAEYFGGVPPGLSGVIRILPYDSVIQMRNEPTTKEMAQIIARHRKRLRS